MTNEIEDAEILLVEDNPTDAELSELALKERNPNCKVLWVKDGAEALDYLFATGAYSGRHIEKFPKVVLLDLRMPKMSGLEVLRRLKADKRTKMIPVVVLTSSREDEDLLDSYDLGVNSYIHKPVNFDHFTQLVADAGYYWLRINSPPSIKE